MPRTIARSAHMRDTATIRLTAKDKADLKLAAMREGLDMSGYLRKVLIQNNIISPLG